MRAGEGAIGHEERGLAAGRSDQLRQLGDDPASK